MLRSLGALLLLALVAGADARADDERATFFVSATVPERVTIDPVGQANRLVISLDDVLRGYKDVSARYLVRHNTVRGWMLQLSPRVGITERIEVRGLSAPVALERDSVEVFRRGTSGQETLSLDFRLMLNAGAAPGVYDMPIHVAATPL